LVELLGRMGLQRLAGERIDFIVGGGGGAGGRNCRHRGEGENKTAHGCLDYGKLLTMQQLGLAIPRQGRAR
jgi:hypothetical protein